MDIQYLSFVYSKCWNHCRYEQYTGMIRIYLAEANQSLWVLVRSGEEEWSHLISYPINGKAAALSFIRNIGTGSLKLAQHSQKAEKACNNLEGNIL